MADFVIEQLKRLEDLVTCAPNVDREINREWEAFLVQQAANLKRHPLIDRLHCAMTIIVNRIADTDKNSTDSICALGARLDSFLATTLIGGCNKSEREAFETSLKSLLHAIALPTRYEEQKTFAADVKKGAERFEHLRLVADKALLRLAEDKAPANAE